jgi:hypothetical protein
MRWWRSNQRFGGCLALAALWLQLVVSFAHFHPETFRALPGAGSPSFDSTAQLASGGSSAPAAPSDHRSKGFPHDNCPICATSYLISSALIGKPAVLRTPIAFSHVPWHAISAPDRPSARDFSFSARAPPIA